MYNLTQSETLKRIAGISASKIKKSEKYWCEQ